MTAFDYALPRLRAALRMGGLGVCLAVVPLAHAQTSPAARAFLDQATEAAAADMFVDALAANASAIAAAPEDSEGYAQRAYLFELLSQPALAASDYRAAARYAPDDGGVQGKLCLYLALTNHDLDGALAACEVAVRLAPLDATILGTRGYAHLRRGEYAKAEADYQASLAQSSASPDEMFGLGVALIHLGKVREGREQIASATLDSAGLVDQWSARGFGLQGEVIAGAPRTSASQAAITTADRRLFLNKGETFIEVADGCGRVTPSISAQERASATVANAGLSWSGECRFGLAHGDGTLGGTAIRFAYGRKISGADGAALAQKLGLAYQAAEKALTP